MLQSFSTISLTSCAEVYTAFMSDLNLNIKQSSVADLAEFVRLAHPEQVMQEAATDACIAISGLVEELNTHLGIYTALKNSVEKGDLKPETEVDKHVAKLFLQDFQQCGIHLPELGRRQVKFGVKSYPP